MTKNADKKREQMLMFCMDDMVPQNHMLRLIDKAIDWTFIYDLVEDKYCLDNGRPSMDPVMLIKIPMIQYLYGIKSMRQTMKEIEVNVAYRWFLGLDMLDPVPHFSTFGKNYTRRFKDTDLFEQIFSKILEDCMKYKLVDTEQIFVDATHVKACANSKKMRKRIAREQTLWYEKELNKQLNWYIVKKYIYPKKYFIATHILFVIRMIKLTKFNIKKLLGVYKVFKNRYDEKYIKRISNKSMKNIWHKFNWRYLI